MTNRADSRIEWFLDSLNREGGFCSGIKVVVVDFTSKTAGGIAKSLGVEVSIPILDGEKYDSFISVRHPKPSVWQGPHRLTKEDFFAASNARNTALCLAPDGWIAYVDDLSVLMPGWLSAVREAMASGYIALGAYKKVKNLVVKNGIATSYDEFPGGIDSRWCWGKDNAPVRANGGMMYGCSVAMPVEALLTINGWPEDLCDGLGSEDYCCGLALQNAGYTFWYDRRMLTLESEELHHVEKPFRKDDWHFENGKPVRGGNGGSDKSHAALEIAKQSRHFPNHFNIREMREKVLRGEPFQVERIPEHDWYSGIALKDL